VAATINIVVGIALLGAWRYGGLVTWPEKGEAETEGIEVEVTAKPVPRRVLPPEPEPPPYDEFPSLEPSRLSRLATVAAWAAGFSGMMVMIYEVGWIRLLSTILGSSTYSFTLMLAAFITGIAVGSALARRLARRGRPFLYFAMAQLAVGLTLLITLPLYARLPYFFLALQSTLTRTVGGYRIYELAKYLFCLAVMIPPTLASGASLPLAGDVVARLRRQIGRPIGEVWAINTLGTIVGALLGGLLLIPWLGVRLTLEIGIVLNTAFGIWLMFLHPRVRRSTLVRLIPICTAAFLLYLVIAPSWDRQALAAGVFRQKELGLAGQEQFRREVNSLEVIFYEEDVNGTVAVVRRGENITLVVNGKADASTFLNDQITQTMIAAIPAMMVPDATEALVVGHGSGQTAGHLLRYPVERVEIVEISSGVVEASHFFDEMNGRPLEDVRTELALQDAKNYLLTRPDRRYDLILSEPSNPWIAGIGGLFTEEYFSALRDRLKPGGAVAQWIHAYEQNDETLGSVFLTFSQIFPYASVWSMSNADLLMVGTVQPVEWDFESAEEALLLPGVREDLERIGTRDLYTLLCRQLMSPIRLREAVSLGGSVNTNDFPFLEYQAPKAFFLDTQATVHNRFDERNRTLRNTDLALVQYLDGRVPTVEERANLVHYLGIGLGTLPRLHASAAAAWSLNAPEDPAAREAALRTGAAQQIAGVREAETMYRLEPGSDRFARVYADVLINTYDTLRSSVFWAEDLADELTALLSDLAERVLDERTYYLYKLGQVHYDQGNYGPALEAIEAAVEELGIAADPTRLFQALEAAPSDLWDEIIPSTDPRTQPDQVLTFLGRIRMKLGLSKLARDAFRDAFRLNPTNRVGAFYIVELDTDFSSRLFFQPPEEMP
jgi:predicted membrane-bound spermidine synthase/tetratricopeptide (TPR) repeat protein